MFFEKASEGKNEFWRYLVTVLLVIIFSQILGSLPLLLVYIGRAVASGNVVPSANPLDFSAWGINPNLGLMLLIFPFMTGLLGLWIGMRHIHYKPFKSIISGFAKVRARRLLEGAGIWFLLMGISLGVHLYFEGDVFSLQFQPALFFQLILVGLLFLPFQTSFEEMMFRGYLMQGFGLLIRNRWAPLLITSLIFGLLHAFNPEVKEFGFWLTMPQYIGWGLFLGMLVILDDGLELPLGIHAANNIFISLFITHQSSALQTPSLFRVSRVNPHIDIIEFFLMSIVFILIAQKLYHWKSWKNISATF